MALHPSEVHGEASPLRFCFVGVLGGENPRLCQSSRHSLVVKLNFKERPPQIEENEKKRKIYSLGMRELYRKR